jgi:hypothetical protein
MLQRQLRAELGGIDGGDIVLRVDATTPTLNPTDVSYRYPFQDLEANVWVAPCDWDDGRWSTAPFRATRFGEWATKLHLVTPSRRSATRSAALARS